MASNTYNFPFGIMDVVTLLRLTTRRASGNGIYVNCPICGDMRGKTYINHEKDMWRCNYCGKGGGMLSLYAEVHHITKSEAYREICEALCVGGTSREFEPVQRVQKPPSIPQAELATMQQIHQTMSLLLTMLSLSEKHREKLKERGLTDEQIICLDYKSTPPPYLCHSYADRLLKQGCTIKGVPGFYLDSGGKWTVKFGKEPLASSYLQRVWMVSFVVRK